MDSADTATERRQLFEQWVKQHSAELLRFARNRVKDPDIADDLVQLALVSAWETMHRFAGESSPRTWLFAILKHKLMDHYRKAYREGVKVSGEVAGSDEPDAMLFNTNGHWLAQHAPALDPALFGDDDDERMHRALQHCLDALPERWRGAIEMKYLQEKEAAAIQQELGLSEANYWQQVHRAKLRLRACIEERINPAKRQRMK